MTHAVVPRGFPPRHAFRSPTPHFFARRYGIVLFATLIGLLTSGCLTQEVLYKGTRPKGEPVAFDYVTTLRGAWRDGDRLIVAIEGGLALDLDGRPHSPTGLMPDSYRTGTEVPADSFWIDLTLPRGAYAGCDNIDGLLRALKGVDVIPRSAVHEGPPPVREIAAMMPARCFDLRDVPAQQRLQRMLATCSAQSESIIVFDSPGSEFGEDPDPAERRELYLYGRRNLGFVWTKRRPHDGEPYARAFSLQTIDDTTPPAVWLLLLPGAVVADVVLVVTLPVVVPLLVVHFWFFPQHLKK